MKRMIGLVGIMLIGMPIWTMANISSVKEGQDAIQGLWTTISDETNEPSSVIRISKKDKAFQGKIVKGLREKKASDEGLCKKCPPPFKDKKIMGLAFLWGLKQEDPTHWTGGFVLDPDTGHIYKVNAQLSEDGQKLYLRGYIGISLFGRTQTWLRRETL